MEQSALAVSCDERGVMAFRGEYGVGNAEAVKSSLIEALSSHDALVFDISGVQSADLTFFQLLYASFLQAANSGKKARCRRTMSEAVEKVADVCGLLEHVAMKDFWE